MDQTFAFCRILGNDLPPRHGEGQTIEGLRFILDHEPKFPGCEKRWLLNRIADSDAEAKIIALLEERRQIYRRIPFEIAEYAKCFLDSDRLPANFDPLQIATGKLRDRADVFAYEWLYRQKNLYAINVNGARNLALADGIASGATWIMLWDGQCYLTATAFESIRAVAHTHPDARYVLVPMARVADNGVALRHEVGPNPPLDEPQVIFHRDARDRFDEQLRYGNSSKAEFIVRIGGPGDWYGRSEWEPVRYPTAIDRGRFVVGGVTFRLTAGVPEAVETVRSRKRWISRFAGLTLHCANLDARLIRGKLTSDTLTCYAPWLAAHSDNATKAAAARLAESYRPAGSPEGLSFQQLAQGVAALVVAGEVSGNAALTSQAAGIYRGWIAAGANMLRAGKRPAILDLRHIAALSDAVRMIHRQGLLSPADRDASDAWFRSMRHHLPGSEAMLAAPNYVGVYCDIVVASLAAFRNDAVVLGEVLSRATLRIQRQVHPWGWQPGGKNDVPSLHEALFSLQGLIALAWVGRQTGIDLWRYAGANHRSVPMATRFVALNRSLFPDYASAVARFDDRIELALRSIPEDAADVEAISGLQRQALTDPAGVGVVQGFPPLLPVLLATERENARAAGQPQRTVA